MASSARIDELQKKFDENPRRYFAPLANEYRKVGDLEQAIFICQEYLPQQPGHMSGHIVYGQALFEAGRHEEAKAVFETALGLDPENLIALRHLGDIARHAGDVAAARAWYQRVLEADPRNEEIARVLGELGTEHGEPAPGAETVPPAGESEPWTLAETAQPSTAEPGSQPEPPAPPVAIEQTPDHVEWGMIEPSSSPEPSPLDLPPDIPVAESTPPAPEQKLEMLDISDFEVPETDLPPPIPEEEPAAAAAAADVDAGPLDDELEFDMPEVPAASAPSEPATVEPIPLPSAEDLAVPPQAAPIDGGHDGTEIVEPSLIFESAEPPDLSESPEPADLPAGMRATPAAPAEMFVTETMAQLYLQQGHLEAAADTYRKLMAQRPGDSELRARLDEVEAQLGGAGPTTAPEAAPAPAGPTIREFLAGLFGGSATGSANDEGARVADVGAESSEAPAHLNDTSPDNVDSGEPLETAAAAPSAPTATPALSGSVDGLFTGVFRQPSDERAALALAQAFSFDRQESLALKGMPARRASDELSLDHVFKPRTPAHGEASMFSFDQFFAEGHEGSAAAGEAPDAPAPSSEDVAQFSAWLSTLKKS